MAVDIKDLTLKEQLFWLFPMRPIALVIQVAIAEGWYRK
jgi:hypothetical protein